MLRTSGDPLALVQPLRRVVTELDPELPVYGVHTMAERVDSSLVSRRVPMLLATGFAAVALFLSAIGIYGVLAYGVAQRRREIGIRMALGSSPRAVFGLVLGDGVRIVAVGLGIGALGALAAGRTMQGLLYGVRPTDPIVMATVAVTLAVVAFLATVIPASRATKIRSNRRVERLGTPERGRQRGVDVGVLELVPKRLGARRGDAAARQQQVVSELAEDDPQRERWGGQPVWPSENSRERAGEIQAADGRRSHGVDRSHGAVVGQGQARQLDPVVAVDPRHPLAAGPDAPAREQPERQRHARQGARFAVEHQSRSEQRNAAVRGRRVQRFGLPFDADARQKPSPGPDDSSNVASSSDG